MRVLDLFSGIGGFALGFTRAGHNVVAFCEMDDYCRSVLKKHWPDVPVFGDVKKLYRFADEYRACELCGEPYCDDCDQHFFECDCIGASQFDDEIGGVDIITAGFPCQDISLLNEIHSDSEGIDGDRSGLWKEALRIIRATQPRWVVLENVAAITVRGLGNVLAGLAASGYDAEWHCIPASAVGGEHLRKRTWIIAHAQGVGVQELWPQGVKLPPGLDTQALSVRDSNGKWKIEPDFLRAINGVSDGVDKSKRIKALGNAVVPQIPEVIAKAISRVEV